MTATTSSRASAQRLDPIDITERVRAAVGQPGAVLHEPVFGGSEWAYVKDCLDTGWVSSVGSYVDGIERKLEAITGARRAVAVVNGTAALHVAMLLCGVESDTEVLVPTLTFIATANAVAYIGAIPHFVESEERTLGLDPVALDRHLAKIAEVRNGACWNRQSGRRISAVVPMHTFGHPVDVDRLLTVATEWCIPIVEDAAESLGSLWKGTPCGRFGKVAALSFNGNKIVTTGGGGAILTDDEDLGRLAKHMTTTAKQPHRWAFNHDMVGFNYRMPNLNAALGVAQLEQLDGFVAAKRRLALRYQETLGNLSGLRVVDEPDGARSNFWLNAIVIDEDQADIRDAILSATNDAGLMTRPVWTLMHHLPMYRACPRMQTPVAESLSRRIINLPSSAHLA